MTGGGEAPEGAVHRGRRLLALQELDDRISHLEAEAAELESALAGDPELERLREAATAAETEREAAEERSRAVERELTAVRHRARTLDRHLYDGTVRNPQDLLGIQHDLASLTPHLDDLEGRLLEAMEAGESADATLSGAREAVAAREAERTAQEVPRRQRLDVVRGALDTARRERGEAASALDPADLRIYTRVASRRRPAAVRLAGDSCGGCHLPLGTREAHQARVGETLVQCSNCDRVVVR